MNPHKKRKFQEDEDRNLHTVFAAAAKAVTALYASAEREHKKSRTQCRHLLERQFQWVLRDYGDKESVPTQALLAYLQHEAQSLEEAEGGGASGGGAQGQPQQRPQVSAFNAFASRPFQPEDPPSHFPQ